MDKYTIDLLDENDNVLKTVSVEADNIDGYMAMVYALADNTDVDACSATVTHKNAVRWE